MSLDKSYLEYPRRQYGMDHDWYDWSLLTERKPVHWPDGKSLALWVNVNVEFFPLNQMKSAVAVPGGMTMPYPDLRHFSLRDYGNRVGLFRVLNALDKAGFTPTISVNGAMVERAPYLVGFLKERQYDIIAHGWQMDHLHVGELDAETEAEWITRTTDTLTSAFGQDMRGWSSPGRLQTATTAELLVRQGYEYMCDWVNDDLPYNFTTGAGNIISMSLSNELDDFFILCNNLHSEDSYAEQIIDASDFLVAESIDQGGRMLALNVHPWLLGQPHRIAAFEQVLQHLAQKAEIWNASAGEIRKSWLQQQNQG